MKRLIFRPAIQVFTLLFVVFFMAKVSTATTAVLLTDSDLITSSRVILLGDVKSVRAQWDVNHQNIYTYVKVQVSRVLKGQLQNQTIVFKQLGGTVGEDSTVIFGAPDFKADQRMLLFLDTDRDGALRIAHLFQGKFDVVTDEQSGQTRVERKIDRDEVNLLGVTDGPDITKEAPLARFTRKINRTLRTRASDVSIYDSKFEGVPIVETPPEYVADPADNSQPGDVIAQYTFLGSFRWFQPDTGQPVTYRVNPNAAPRPNGGTVEINQALAAWSNVQTTALVLQNIGSTSAVGFQQDGVTAISYDDPLDQMSDPVGCSGTLAIGGVTSGGGSTIVIGGQTFSHIFEGDVVFNRNFGCFLGVSANLAEVATHEIGHSIGFGHSSDSAAIMYATAHGNGRGATLGSDDIAAVSFLYPGSKNTQPPPAYGGNHEAADCNVIAGWAWDANQPNTAINVGIYDGNTLIATVSANQFRQDLLNAGLGNGFHAFNFLVPANLKNGQPHSIRVRFGATSVDVPGTPKTITCNSGPVYQGNHEAADCNIIAGWAWDANQPNTAINVGIYDGNTLIATVSANQFRQDLLNAGLGNGFHAFNFLVPANLKNGQPHSIRVRFGTTSVDVPGTPRTITCNSTPVYQGNHEVADCNRISGWVWDATQPNTPISVDIYDGNTLIAVVAANQFRQDLLNAGLGNGNHAFTLSTPASLKNGQPHSIRVRFAGTSIDVPGTLRTIVCAGP